MPVHFKRASISPDVTQVKMGGFGRFLFHEMPGAHLLDDASGMLFQPLLFRDARKISRMAATRRFDIFQDKPPATPTAAAS